MVLTFNNWVGNGQRSIQLSQNKTWMDIFIDDCILFSGGIHPNQPSQQAKRKVAEVWILKGRPVSINRKAKIERSTLPKRFVLSKYNVAMGIIGYWK